MRLGCLINTLPWATRQLTIRLKHDIPVLHNVIPPNGWLSFYNKMALVIPSIPLCPSHPSTNRSTILTHFNVAALFTARSSLILHLFFIMYCWQLVMWVSHVFLRVDLARFAEISTSCVTFNVQKMFTNSHWTPFIQLSNEESIRLWNVGIKIQHYKVSMSLRLHLKHFRRWDHGTL